ncbi:PRC-barrel domain-containing protein [Psychromarinibacter sp. S121]|uniref:PRC-barrel domain-containing protein n=1 Tax=Psychromarinibacter sp. S121 TaxID=3415127 RepID=UPI003C7BE19E
MLTRAFILASAVMVQAPAVIDDSVEPELVPAAASTTAIPEIEFLPETALTFTGLDVDALMRAAVIDRNDRVVGSVAELMVSGTGRITDAVVRLTGGPLSLTSEKVVIGFDDLKVEDAGDAGVEAYVVHAALDKASIDAMPRFNP